VRGWQLPTPLTADDLILLKESGVSANVILALQDLPAAEPEYRPRWKSAAIDLPPDTPPLALEGYCPVAMVDRRTLVAGNTGWGAIHKGKTYLFSDADAQMKFLADPERYTPIEAWNDPGLKTDERQAQPAMRESGPSRY
jgi:YHS domain-containing protein